MKNQIHGAEGDLKHGKYEVQRDGQTIVEHWENGVQISGVAATERWADDPHEFGSDISHDQFAVYWRNRASFWRDRSYELEGLLLCYRHQVPLDLQPCPHDVDSIMGITGAASDATKEMERMIACEIVSSEQALEIAGTAEVSIAEEAVELLAASFEEGGDPAGAKNIRRLCLSYQDICAIRTIAAQISLKVPHAHGEAVKLTNCCGREECGGECGSPWRGMSWVMVKKAESAESRDAQRLDFMDKLTESYGFENEHLGNRWVICGPYRDIRTAIDAEQAAVAGLSTIDRDNVRQRQQCQIPGYSEAAIWRDKYMELRSHCGIVGPLPSDSAYEAAREEMLDWKGGSQRAEARLRDIGWSGIDASEPPAVLDPIRTLELLAEVYDAMGAPRGPARIMADAVLNGARGKKS